MSCFSKRMLSILIAITACSGAALAEGDLTNQPVIDVKIELGNKQGELKFFPASLSFETGRLYRLTISNPSPQKHYFSSAQFAKSIYTRKVQINRPGGKAMVEVKGYINEIEVYPGSSAEWWFVALKTGQIDDLKCTINGHTEAGMTGYISIH